MWTQLGKNIVLTNLNYKTPRIYLNDVLKSRKELWYTITVFCNQFKVSGT